MTFDSSGFLFHLCYTDFDNPTKLFDTQDMVCHRIQVINLQVFTNLQDR
jgi:hypothetical protein